jgi:formate-dependent nitrite reductase membrane component NrfD
MDGKTFTHLALGFGGMACFLKLAPHFATITGAPMMAVAEATQAAALAWPLVVLGMGLWIAALSEVRAKNNGSKAALIAAGLALALGALLPV